MLTPGQRLDRYFAQTGRAELTPRQMRRHAHKARRQLPEAVQAREQRTAQRLAVVKAARASGFASTP